jgi:hypothetical protein
MLIGEVDQSRLSMILGQQKVSSFSTFVTIAFHG